MEGLNQSGPEAPRSPHEALPEGTLRNSSGVPLVLFRGSSLPVSLGKDERYKKEHLGHATEAPSAGEAFFFTDNRKTAEYYSRGKNPNIERAVKEGGDPHIDNVNLVMKNPLVHDFKGKIYRGEETTYFNLLRRAKEEGYDGVIFKNTFDGGEYSKFDAIIKGKFGGETIYGVFEPEQVVVQKTEVLIDERRRAKLLEAEQREREKRRAAVRKRLGLN